MFIKLEKFLGLLILLLKLRVFIRESKFFYFLDRIVVEVVSFVGINDRILLRILFGILLIKFLECIEIF